MPKAITISSNLALNNTATSGATSQVLEPSIASNGPKLFMTSNWFASRSTDNGASWTYVSPYTSTPSAAGGFCCDQLSLYDPARKIWIWIKQYVKTSSGANVFRIVVSKDADFASGSWYWWDIAPTTLNSSWTGIWFDYPDAAISKENLYVTFNLFNNSNQWQRAAVMRFPLDTLASGGALGFGWWSTTNNGSLRLTQQGSPSSNMYFASHNSTKQLRLFHWPDGGGNISIWNVGVNTWSPNISSTAPNGVNWLARCDSRITAGSLGGGEISLMWTAGAASNRPNAYCKVVRIRESNKSVINQPDIWSNSVAWAYPACCYNNKGELGFAAFYGSGSRNPGHVVGCYDTGGNSWPNRTSKAGSHAPNAGRWGDYINVRADVPDSDKWVATGFTEEGGDTGADIVPRAVRFHSKSPVLPVFADQLGANEILLGAIVAISTTTGLIFKPLFGLLSDRQGQWIWLLIGTVLFAVTPLLYLGANTTGELVALRLFHGLATAIYGPVTLAFIGSLGDRGQAERFGWFGLSRTGSYILGPLIGGALLNFVSAPQVYALTSLIAVLAFFPVLSLRSQATSRQAGPHSPGLQLSEIPGFLLRNHPLIAFGLVEMSSRVGVYAVKTFMPLMILSQGGSPLEAGAFLSIQEFFVAVTRPVAGRFADRFDAAAATAVAGLICVSAALATISGSASTEMLIAAAAAIGVGQGAYQPAALSMIAQETKAEARGFAFGVQCAHFFRGGEINALALMVIDGIFHLVDILATVRHGGGGGSHQTER
eukprot:g1707.t1